LVFPITFLIVLFVKKKVTILPKNCTILPIFEAFIWTHLVFVHILNSLLPPDEILMARYLRYMIGLMAFSSFVALWLLLKIG
jgi:hypothetical protein